MRQDNGMNAKSTTGIWALAAAAAACTLPAAATPVLVYSEAVSGDMADAIGGSGVGGPIVMHAGQSQIKGRTDSFLNPGGVSTVDFDAFHFSIEAGRMLKSVTIAYLFGATVGNAQATASIGYYDQNGVVPPAVLEFIDMPFPGSAGSELLFDGTAVLGQAVLGGNHVLSVGWSSLRSNGVPTSLGYDYTITFDIGAAAVPEPATLPLLLLALTGAAAAVRRRRSG